MGSILCSYKAKFHNRQVYVKIKYTVYMGALRGPSVRVHYFKNFMLTMFVITQLHRAAINYPKVTNFCMRFIYANYASQARVT